MKNRSPILQLVQGVKINKVIQFLTYSDILMLSGWGLISPIMAVFLTEQIKGGSIELVGLSTSVYFIVKSVVQIPVARWIDLRKGEHDDFWVMVIGSVLISLSAFSYMIIQHPWQVYLVQIMYGLGGALSYPGWLAIFSRHLDRKEEALEWSLYYTATDVGSALTAGLGALLVTQFGFKLVFLIVGVLSLAGTIFLAGIVKKLHRS